MGKINIRKYRKNRIKLLKSAQQQFYPIFSSFLDKLNWKTSPLVRSEILALFVSTLTTDDKHF